MDSRTGRWVGAALLAAALLVAVVIVAASLAGPRAPSGSPSVPPASAPATTAAPTAEGPRPAPSATACLRRPGTVRLAGKRDTGVQVDSPRSDASYDLRGVVSVAYPERTRYPLVFGRVRHGRPTGGTAERLCIVGGTVVGQQPRDLTWQEMKRRHDGDGLRVQGGGWYVVDGLRVDNVEDGVAPFGDGFVGRNLYLTYIRDDCIENDAVSGGYVADSLFDGCSMGISERPSKGFSPTRAPAAETFTLDGVLLRLRPMPRDDAPDGLGNGQLFKWSQWGNRLVLRNSIFLVERVSMNGKKAMAFPAGTLAENVTLVWTGPGDYPAPVPAGVRVTKDRAVWDTARSSWLARHGYPAN